MILPLFGGFFIDYFGIRLGIGIFSFVVIGGHALFTFGVFESSFSVMVLGRLLFALTGENISVSQSTIISKWFRQKELAFAFGSSIIAVRLGGMANNIVTPRIAHSTNSAWFPCFLGVLTCIVSFIFALVVIWMDYKADKTEGKLRSQHQANDPSTQIRLSDLKKFNFFFWLILVNSLLVYSVLSAFLSSANDFLVKQFNIDEIEAGNMLLIIYIVSMCVSPLIGMIIDRIGQRTFLLNVATLLMIGSLLMFLLIPGDEDTLKLLVALSLFLFGAGYAIYTATQWSCISLVVEEKTLGTAYGIAAACTNGGGALVLIIVGHLQDAAKDYKAGYAWSTIFLAVLAGFGLASGVMLRTLNQKRNGNLDDPLLTKRKASIAIAEDLLFVDHRNNIN